MEYDIFISYSHKDNIADTGEDGWVDSFHKGLFKYLTGRLGRKAEIWRDQLRMRGNYRLDQALHQNVKSSRIFLPILSPSYNNSAYCLEELRIFCEHNNNDNDVETCIFPIVKSEIDAPPALIEQNLLKFAFFALDAYGEPSQELDPSFGEKSRNEFNQKIADLAREVAEFIEIVEKKEAAKAAKEVGETTVIETTETNKEEETLPDEKVPNIYLAEPSLDLFDKYLEIKRDLEERKNQGKIKFEFLPRDLPQEATQISEKTDEAEDYKQKIKKDIARSRLTIHLIGKRPNNFPPESRQSYLHLETEAAALRDGETDFNRLVWIPRNLYTEEELQRIDKDRHKAFVKQIRDAGVGGDGLMQDSFEDFKDRIQDIIKPKDKLPPRPPLTDKPIIYILSDQPDLRTVDKLEKKVSSEGCVIFSTRDYWGDPQMDKYHLQYLCECDAVLIYWDTTPVPWVKITAQQLDKTVGYGRSKEFLARGVFWEGEVSKRETYTFNEDLRMIKGYEYLPAFISEIKSNKEALHQ